MVSSKFSTVMIDDRPWLVAKDVYNILSPGDVSLAFSCLDADEKGRNLIRPLEESSRVRKSLKFKLGNERMG